MTSFSGHSISVVKEMAYKHSVYRPFHIYWMLNLSVLKVGKWFVLALLLAAQINGKLIQM